MYLKRLKPYHTIVIGKIEYNVAGGYGAWYAMNNPVGAAAIAGALIASPSVIFNQQFRNIARTALTNTGKTLGRAATQTLVQLVEQEARDAISAKDLERNSVCHDEDNGVTCAR